MRSAQALEIESRAGCQVLAASATIGVHFLDAIKVRNGSDSLHEMVAQPSTADPSRKVVFPSRTLGGRTGFRRRLNPKGCFRIPIADQLRMGCGRQGRAMNGLSKRSRDLVPRGLAIPEGRPAPHTRLVSDKTPSSNSDQLRRGACSRSYLADSAVPCCGCSYLIKPD
jgi:hypothetical protein